VGSLKTFHSWKASCQRSLRAAPTLHTPKSFHSYKIIVPQRLGAHLPRTQQEIFILGNHRSQETWGAPTQGTPKTFHSWQSSIPKVLGMPLPREAPKLSIPRKSIQIVPKKDWGAHPQMPEYRWGFNFVANTREGRRKEATV
jgi:hypothetical protein